MWPIAIVVLLLCALSAALAWGGPRAPPALASVSQPWAEVDFADLPAPRTLRARDGTALSCRTYTARGTVTELGVGASTAQRTIVLIHGSSGRSENLHVLARALAAAGFVVHVPDVRGHGESGTRGQIDYVGQLEDDLEDCRRALVPSGPVDLAGFSAGGGFVLRFAADPRRTLFDHYLLLAPFFSQTAPTYRPASGGWVSVGLPRIVALALLNRLGIRALNRLPVTAYALPAGARDRLTPWYGYALAMNFRPHDDYRADIRAATQPLAVLVGDDDDQFYAERFDAVFRAAGRAVPVGRVLHTGHLGLTLSAPGVRAVVDTLVGLHTGTPGPTLGASP